MKRALIGNGGHAREVMLQLGRNDLVRFVDDEYCVEGDDLVLPLSSFNPDEYEIMIAIGNSFSRANIERKLPINTRYFSFIHPTAIIADDVVMGKGSFIGAFSFVSCNVKLGNHCLLNRAVHIGHDSNIGNFFSAMPSAIVSGSVNVKNRVYMGTNSSTKENVSIESDVTIGAQACVVSDLLDMGTYVGVPAKLLY